MISTEKIADTKSNQQPPVINDYLTPAELARQLGISLRTLARWHSLRIGAPRTQIGRKIFYHREAVQGWLRAHEDRKRRGNAR